MNRIRVVLTLVLSFLITVANAQDSGQMAASAFAQANYDDAAQLYDMAASLASDSALKTQYYNMAKKSRECKSLTSRAASLYSSGDYDAARSTYSRILTLNPSDKTAKSRISSIDSRMAKQKSMQKQENAYADALKSVIFRSGAMDVSALQAFIKKYPKDSRVELIRKMVAHLGSQMRVVSEEDVEYYVAAGKEFLAVSNNDVAAYLFDCATPYADLDALYYKALIFAKDSKGYKTLLAMAAEAGHKEAQALVRNIKYDKIAAQTYYSSLKNYRNDFESAVFVLINQGQYFMPSLDPLPYIISQLPSDIDDLANYDDGLLYYLGTSGKIEDQELCYNLISAALLKGNVDAIAEYATEYAKDEYKDPLYLLAYAFGVESAGTRREGAYAAFDQDAARSYVDMACGQDITSDEAWDLYLDAWYRSAMDAHETLYVAALMPDTSYTFKEFKTFWKNRKNLTYDVAFVNKLRADLRRRSHESEYYAKVLKTLSKAKVQNDSYEGNTLKNLIDLLELKDFHRTRSVDRTSILE